MLGVFCFGVAGPNAPIVLGMNIFKLYFLKVVEYIQIYPPYIMKCLASNPTLTNNSIISFELDRVKIYFATSSTFCMPSPFTFSASGTLVSPTALRIAE